jgi:hypothetical protein
MHIRLIQSIGMILAVSYAVLIVWLYVSAPRSLREAATNVSVAAGTYEVDTKRFDAGLDLFRREQYPAAREEWERADPGHRDARTQFYTAYSYYREGWGRTYNDDALFKLGLDAVNRSIEASASSGLLVDDPNLQMHTPAELKAELQQGLEKSWSDLNPLKIIRGRK